MAGQSCLDEIGDMSAVMQAKILRALQERIVDPTPWRHGCECGCAWVLAATHHDLPSLVSANGFREDLFHRLNMFCRSGFHRCANGQQTIMPLAEHFLQLSAGQRAPKRLSVAAAALLSLTTPGPAMCESSQECY